ncbi:MAG: hypothetical protein R3B89_34285 [Polyangiaceae bacterium]
MTQRTPLTPRLLACAAFGACLLPRVALAQPFTLQLGEQRPGAAPDPDAALFVDRQLSLGASFSQASSESTRERGVAAVVGQFGSLDSTRLGWVQRSRTFGMLGGGSSGVEGGIGGEISAGPLFEMVPGEGSFVRGGFSAELMGNRHFYSSWITLPRLEVGYHSHDSSRLLEGYLFVAPAWTGRVKLSDKDGQHKLGGTVEHGAAITFATPEVHFDLTYQRFAVWNRDGVAHVVRATACGELGRPSICFRARLYDAPQDPEALGQARIGYFGVFLGLGPLVADP